MELNWLQSLIMGLFSGLADVLPVSSQAHQALLLTFFGGEAHPLTRFVIHLATLLALLVVCWGQIARIRRQLRLARLPKRIRNRTPDMASLMDARIIRTACWPVVICLLLGRWIFGSGCSLVVVALASLLNAVLLYLPNLFATADKDSRLVTPFEGLQMGLGAGAAVLPGISSVGACYSVGILHGVDRGYMIHLTMMIHMVYLAGQTVFDVLDAFALSAVTLDADTLLSLALTGAAAAVGTVLGYRVMRKIASASGLGRFSFYSFGLALLTFILYLMV